MEKFTKIKFAQLLLLAFISFILVKCANQMPPPGGDVDKTPPEIVETVPQNGTVNYDENYVEFSFSEYVDKRSVQDAFFISPNMEGKIEFDWSGKSVEIIFEDSLRDKTTYIVTIGADVKDLNNNNNMARSLTLTFSTGDEIDYCSIEGKIYDKKPAGTMIFAYMLGDTIPNPSAQKPDYLTQVGEDGFFKLLGMAPAQYRVFAVRDEFKNLVYNTGEDNFGAPFTDVLLTKSDSLITDLNYLLTKEDTLIPQVSGITMTDKHHFLVEFSERVDSSRISAGNFSIFDSTANKQINLDYIYKGKSNGLEYFLSNKDTLIQANSNFMVVENIFDPSGNELIKEIVGFVVSTAVDTMAPTLKKVITEFDNDKIDFVDPSISLQFNDAFGFDNIFDAFRITGPKDQSVRYVLKSIDGATVKLIPEAPLKDNTEFSISMNLNKFIDAAGNKLDSIHTIKVGTLGELDFSGISGALSYEDTTHGKVIVLENLADPRRNYKMVLLSENKYDFKRIIPGMYFIWSFIDTNNDTTFNYGAINPFEYSERFVYYPDTLDLRPRWPVGDIEFSYPPGNN